MGRIKVLHLIKSLGRGGAETLLPETISQHDADAFEFVVGYFLPWKNQMVGAITDVGVQVVCFDANNNIKMLLNVRKIQKFCQANKIQIIHCHLPWAGFVGRLIHKITGIPVVYTEHNMQERYHFLTRFLNKQTFDWQSAAVSVSHDVSNSIRKNIAPRIRQVTVANGVNTEKFVRDKNAGEDIRRKLNISAGSVVVGTIAVFRFQKRLLEWLEVAAAVRAVAPETVFIIVGAGPLKETVENKVIELGLGDSVHMPGLQEDVKPWLSAMDIYMMSSVFEGLPIALLEAMSMSCAVVTTNAGGIKEVIRPDLDGLVVDVDEWKSLAAHVISLTSDSNRLGILSAAARARVADKFSLARMVGELEGLYREIIQSQP
jgi:glycosyltransferase involved in cell wall biosynthesis